MDQKEINIEDSEVKTEGQSAAEQVVHQAEKAANTEQKDENGENAAKDKQEGRVSRRDRRRHAERQLEEMTQKVEQMGAKMAEMQEKYMRVYSEYENYRKRTSAEKASLILNGGKDVIKLMLPVLDDMERALANMSDGDTAKEGMQLIYKNMVNALQQKGLKPMEAMGAKFDENFHEAITQIPAPTPEVKGCVLDVVKKGYFLHEEVLRFAQVVVGC